MSNIRIERASNVVYPKFYSFYEALEHINKNLYDFKNDKEIVMVIDYDSGASKAYRIELTSKVVEI